MSSTRRVPIFIGCLLLALAALFPPLRPTPQSNIGQTRPAWPERGMLFSSNYTVEVAFRDQNLTVNAEIDPGRLLAEAVLLAALFGGIAVFLPGRREGPG